MAQDSTQVPGTPAGPATLQPAGRAPGDLLSSDGTVPAAAQFHPGVKFDAVTATNAYLATLPADQRARSDSYFEGGYWITLWGFLISSLIFLIILRTGLSRRMRDRAERTTRTRPLQTVIYWVLFSVVVYVLTYPWTLYTGYFREHQYGLATQGFASWMGDEGKALLISLILGGLVVTALYGIVRRLPRSWHIWGAIVGIVFVIIGAVIAPVYITPIFNNVTPLTDARVRDPILSLARANGIPADNVYVINASKQSKRISANVSGLFGTTRVTLNDNLLNRSTLPQIEAVMGHEMGHYVMHHGYKGIMFFTIMIVIAFAFLKWAFGRAQSRWGESWGIRDIGDTAGLPLVALVLGIFFFVVGPVFNNFSRTVEGEADIFGLNAARQPDGFAQAAVKLSEYRKLDPGPVEEWMFYDHPSGRARIFASMRWKAEHEADYTSSQIRR
jgi:STE24 endopeptidase